MTAYLGSGGITPPILKHGTKWREVVNFTPRPFIPGGESRYPLNMRLGGPQRRSGRFEVRNVFECCLIEVTEMLAGWRGSYVRLGIPEEHGIPHLHPNPAVQSI